MGVMLCVVGPCRALHMSDHNARTVHSPKETRPPMTASAGERSRTDARPRSGLSGLTRFNHLRRSGTPETILVSDLVRTHTSPGHENGPQAELAGR
jgi:hypothetical protein